MKIRYGYEIGLTLPAPTPIIAMLSLHPSRNGDLLGPETFFTTPGVPHDSFVDSFGNVARRLTAPAGPFSMWGDGTVRDSGMIDPMLLGAAEVPVPSLPPEALVFLLGSRYCETDVLVERAWELFGHIPPGWGRVQAICDFVHQHITFDYMQARSTRTAAEVFTERVGVCRDFAHLAVALCRCMNIPARYVNGHLGDIGVVVDDPMDYAAWMEVYLDAGWVTFDPRNNDRRIGRIVISRGRDAADTALFNTFGPHELTGFRVWTYEVE